MADGTVDTPVVDQQPTIQDEIAANMALAFGGGIVPEELVPIVDAPVVVDPNAAPAAVAIEPTPFSFDTLKQEFQYEKPEDVITEIKELRALKAAPPKAEIVYENEESKKLHLALMGGKKDEVYRILAEQDRLDKLTTTEVTKDNAGDILKLAMQVKHKDLTPQEIDYKLNKQYALPKKPVQDLTNEEDVDFAVRMTEWNEQVADVEMNKIIDAKLVRPDLETAKSKIVLPDLESDAPDETYLSYQTMMQEQATLDAQTKEAYKNIGLQDVSTKFNFNDEASKVNFNFEYTPSEPMFKKAVEIASDPQKFFASFKNSDGSPNRQMYVDAILYAIDKQAILSNAITQGSNARIKAQLPDNDTGGLVRQMPGQEPVLNELDEAMKRNGLVKTGG